MADPTQSLVSFLLSKSAVTDIIGDRIESDDLTQGVAVPAVTYRRISTSHANNIMGTKAGIARSRVEINCLAGTRLAADALAETIRKSGLLDIRREEIAGTTIQSVLIDAGVRHYTEGPETGDHEFRYVATFDLQIAFNEDF